MRVFDAVSETSQRQLGESDSPIEDELEEAFIRMVDEGGQRLHRTKERFKDERRQMEQR